MKGLFERVRNAAYEIIDRKGYTNTAIGMVIVRLAEAVLEDQKSVFPVSRMLEGEYGLIDVCLSVPSVIGINGLEAAILPTLDDTDLDGLHHSAEVLSASVKGILV
jgi:L-lactate dehydrogenase